jgi:hypothetical protein
VLKEPCGIRCGIISLFVLHSFRPYPKHPAVAYLIRLHADIGGRILDNKRQAERLATDAKAVELVIQMFDPEFNARAIAARRRNPWFKRGKMFRHALDAHGVRKGRSRCGRSWMRSWRVSRT